MPTHYGFPTFDERSKDRNGAKEETIRIGLNQTAKRLDGLIRELLTDFWVRSHNCVVTIDGAMTCEVRGIDNSSFPGHSYCWWVRSEGLTCMEVSLYASGFLVSTHRKHPEYVRLAQLIGQLTGHNASCDTFQMATAGT